MIRTTVIGSQPGFKTGILRTGMDRYECTEPGLGESTLRQELANQQAVNMENQLATGLDIVAEGEIGRADRRAVGHAYVSYIGRFMDGLSEPFTRFKPGDPPFVITGKLNGLNPDIICDDWAKAQALSNRPVKINLPGPLTFAGRFANLHHRRLSECSYEFAHILNEQIQALVERGCQWIQLDDPGLVGNPTAAVDFGVAHVEAAFRGVPEGVERIVHLCRGNEYRLNGRNRQPLAEPYYANLAPHIAESNLTGISIESPHTYSREFRLAKFGEKTIFLGIIDVNADFPSENEMIGTIRAALREIPSERLFITPNCGIKHLSHENAKNLLKTMVSAVDTVNSTPR
mgnify:CR=1 FL=1